MPEQCGCKVIRGPQRAAGPGFQDVTLWCPLHARAAEMREAVATLLNDHPDGLSDMTCDHIETLRSLLEEIR